MELVVRHEVATVLRDLEPEDEPAVLALFNECRDWFEFATGQPAGSGDVQGLYYALPSGCDFTQKALLVADSGGRITALVDLILRYPAIGDCTVGAFLVAPEYRRRHLGTALARALFEEARKQGVRRVHTTVTAGWQSGARFLDALGFTIGAAAAQPGGNRNVGSREKPVHQGVLELRVAVGKSLSTADQILDQRVGRDALATPSMESHCQDDSRQETEKGRQDER
jgi:GNAT superfamily N-acetyltransferase